MTAAPPDAVGRARALARLFHPDLEAFARFAAATPADLPAGPRQLLDHSSHMTVAMERFHAGPVSLAVAARKACEDGRYAREIMLATPDGRVVQHGVVRIDLSALPAVTAEAIRAESAPLGRILIDAGLLCEVQDVALLEVQAGRELAALCGQTNVTTMPRTFGRVATIGVAGRATVELLEIVAPGTAD
jgi:hypothetical protein